jgi:DNA-binding NarL/FixJ family response regulator
MASFLILEDQAGLLNQLQQAIRTEFPGAQILPARSVAEGQVFLSEFTIDAFILDVELPDGNGIDFLCDVKTVAPDAVALLMADSATPEHREQAESIGVLKFLEKPVQPPSVAKLVRRGLEPPTVGETAETSTQFKAELSNLTTIDIIQLKCLARASQVLRFQLPDGRSGKIHFQKGEIVHAETKEKTGTEAFNDIVGWKGGRVEESLEPITANPTIQSDWQALLMEAVQFIDESGGSIQV